jgi:hypothetical protein
MEKGGPPNVISQWDVMHNLPTKLPPKLWDEKSLSFPGLFKVI